MNEQASPGHDARAELRIGLVGCGEVCEHKHLPGLRRVTGARVVAVADRDRARGDRVAGRFAIPRVFTSARELLESGEVDAVGVLVPPGEHSEVTLAALAAGTHVLVEKPVTLDLAEADALVAAARAATGRSLMGFHMRWHRLVREARSLVREGAVGTVESIRTTWNSPRPDRGIPAWKVARASGGGALVELGVHLFDLWRHLLGAEVVEVHARSRHAHRDDESAVVTATMSNGVLASASISERTGHEIELEISGDRGRLRVGCQRFDGLELLGVRETGGMIVPRLRGLGRTVRELPRGLSRMRTLGDYGDSYRGQWQHLVDVVARGAEPESTLEDGREALRVVLAAAASATEARPVRVDEAPTAITHAARG